MTDFIRKQDELDALGDNYMVSVYHPSNVSEQVQLAIHSEYFRESFYYTLRGEFIESEKWLPREEA